MDEDVTLRLRRIAVAIVILFMLLGFVGAGVSISTRINQQARDEAKRASLQGEFNALLVQCMFEQLTEFRINASYYNRNIFDHLQVPFQPPFKAPESVPPDLKDQCIKLRELLKNFDPPRDIVPPIGQENIIPPGARQNPDNLIPQSQPQGGN